MDDHVVTKGEVRQAAAKLRLSGLPLCVHASLRSFGWVEGGATAIVEALLNEGCTVMVPSFSWAFSIPPPMHQRPARNGCNYERIDRESNSTMHPYTSDTSEVDHSMGAVAKAVVARPGRARGAHPISSFAAVGPVANELVAGQTALDVCAPLDSLAAAGGAVVLMGVGLDSMTLLHLAERRAGRNLFKRWAKAANCDPIMVEVGGCSMGFPRLEPVLASARRERFVGPSRWQTFDAASALEAATEAIRNNPTITHCADATCERCRDAVLGGPR
jgi:aminoglycoside N3'-acetyltransferase